MTLVDVGGRRLRSLRLSVTDRCNLRCEYCMPEAEYIWLQRKALLTFEEMGRLVDVFASAGVDRLRLTGGEPLLRRDLAVLIRQLAAKDAIHDLALTTNGVLLADQAQDLQAAGLPRITVSLDTLRRERFRELTRFDAHDAVLAGLDRAAALWPGQLKIDTVVMRGVNDDELVDLLDYARDLGAELRFIEYMDVGGATGWSLNAVVSRREILLALEARYGPICAVQETSSAPADRFVLPDGSIFGVISSTTAPFCQACDRSRLTADGLWYLCLYGHHGTDLRKPLRARAGDAAIRQIIASAWEHRTDRGAENRLQAERRKPLIPIATLRRDSHLEMHTRGG